MKTRPFRITTYEEDCQELLEELGDCRITDVFQLLSDNKKDGPYNISRIFHYWGRNHGFNSTLSQVLKVESEDNNRLVAILYETEVIIKLTFGEDEK